MTVNLIGVEESDGAAFGRLHGSAFEEVECTLRRPGRQIDSQGRHQNSAMLNDMAEGDEPRGCGCHHGETWLFVALFCGTLFSCYTIWILQGNKLVPSISMMAQGNTVVTAIFGYGLSITAMVLLDIMYRNYVARMNIATTIITPASKLKWIRRLLNSTIVCGVIAAVFLAMLAMHPYDVNFATHFLSAGIFFATFALWLVQQMLSTYLFYGPQSPMLIKQKRFILFALLLGLVALFTSIPFLISHDLRTVGGTREVVLSVVEWVLAVACPYFLFTLEDAIHTEGILARFFCCGSKSLRKCTGFDNFAKAAARQAHGPQKLHFIEKNV